MKTGLLLEMDVHYDIEKVSLELILFCLRDRAVVRQYPLMFCKFNLILGTALQNVQDAFAGSFHNIYGTHSFEELDPGQFARTSVRICLKMSRMANPLHILLACAFITEYVSHLAQDRNCVKLTFVAWKCLTVIIKRRMQIEFEDPTRWSRLLAYVMQLNACVNLSTGSNLDAICPNAAFKERTLAMVEDCNEISEDIDLTPEEEEVFDVDIYKEEMENFVNVPACEFCDETCVIAVRFCCRKHMTGYSTNYRTLPQRQNVLQEIHFNTP